MDSRADAGAWFNCPFLTLKERDNETGLDYFGARYYGSTQGRFTSADPLRASGKPYAPQSWNRYSYCLNNPLGLIDPTGMIWVYQDLGNGQIQLGWFNGTEEQFRKQFAHSGWQLYSGPSVVHMHKGGWYRLENNGRATPVKPDFKLNFDQDRLNVSAGMFDGSVPFGRDIRHGLGLTGGIDEDSQEYKNAEKIGNGTTTGLLLFTGGGEVEEAGNAVKEAVDLAEEVGSKGLRFGPDQDAVIQLAKQAKRTGGVTEEEAKTLLDWAKEYGVKPAQNHIGTDHWVGGDHIRVGPINHIPVKTP